MIDRAPRSLPPVGLLVLAGAAVTAVVAALSLGIGQASVLDAQLGSTVLSLRASRLGASALAGSALAVGGVLAQGLFRNPLASPSVIGTTAGAAFGGRLFIVLTEVLGGAAVTTVLLVPLGCTLGALVALAVLLLVARLRDDSVVLLLAGFLVSSLFFALGGLVVSLAEDRWELVRAMTSFSLGDVSSAGPEHLVMSLPLVALGTVAAWFWSGPLDVLLTGEEEARSLGLDVSAVRTGCILWIALLTAAAVAVGGSVSFVGLVVPHALRPLVGVRHRALVLGSAFGGAVFLAVCDLMTRVIPGRTELPLGVVTGLIGAPTFLWLLVRSRREVLRA